MKKIVTTLAAAAVLVAPAIAGAQDEKDIAAYIALNLTPIGALPPSLSTSMLGGQAEGFGIQTRYGYMDGSGDAIHNFGVGVQFRAPWSGDLGVTLGYGKQTCEGCESATMIGASWQSRLTASDVGGAQVALGVQTDVGYSKLDDVSSLSASVAAPIALHAGSGSWTYSPFIAPGFGYGRLSDDIDSLSGTRFMLGGGIALNSAARGLAFNVGVQKVFIQDGEMQYGVGMTWHPGR